MITIIVWSTSDIAHVRIRNLILGLEKNKIKLKYYVFPIWKAEKNKAILPLFLKLFYVLKLFFVYPYLVISYIFGPKHDYVYIPYMGQLDLLIIKPFAFLKRAKIIWDIYISLYDTLVYDRKLLRKHNPLSYLTYLIEWIDFRMANVLIADTKSHAKYFKRLYNLKDKRINVVFVGADSESFHSLKSPKNNCLETSKASFTVLFYGNISPLHGVEVIVKAAYCLNSRKKDIIFYIIGKGQASENIDTYIQKNGINNIIRYDYIPYEQLNYYLNIADIGLGIFSDNPKSNHVIPNKIFQTLLTYTPVITANTEAINEIKKTSSLIFTIPPNNSYALAEKILEIRNNYQDIVKNSNKQISINQHFIANQFIKIINNESIQ